MKTYRKTFDSWDEFVGYLRTTPPLWPRNECQSFSAGRMSNWFGSNSWDEAMDYAVKGHPVGRTLIDKAVTKFTSEPEPLWETAPVGAFPCIPAYSAGVPEDMFTISETAQKISQPIVRIVVNMTASSIVEPHEIVNRGAAIVTLIDRIQASGKRVELVATEHSSSLAGRYLFSVTVKRPEEPVDMDRIGLVFATPIFLRRFMFRMMECTAPNVVPGYGRPEHFPDDFTDRDLVIPKIVPGECDTVEQANATVAALWEEANLREAA